VGQQGKPALPLGRRGALPAAPYFCESLTGEGTVMIHNSESHKLLPRAARALGAPAVHCRECSGLCARPLGMGPMVPSLAAGRAGCVGVGISTYNRTMYNTEKVAYSR
jgi:hypothetical protein